MKATRAIDSDIRPISDLRNKFAEIADYVQGGWEVLFGLMSKIITSTPLTAD